MGAYSLHRPVTDTPYKALKDWSDHRDRMQELEALYPKRYPPLFKLRTPSPMRYTTSEPIVFNSPLEKALGYNYNGQPLHVRRRPLTELFEPRVSTPISRYVRDPWWWDYPELRPYQPSSHTYKPSPFYLRNSYLSPVKRTYLWGHHPIRPFSTHYY